MHLEKSEKPQTSSCYKYKRNVPQHDICRLPKSLRHRTRKCYETFVWLVSVLHTEMKVSVSLSEVLSEPLKVGNRVKQGCVLAATLFSVFFFLWSCLPCIQFGYRVDRVKTCSTPDERKPRNVLVRELMFANDIAFVAYNQQDTQEIIRAFSKYSKAFGLKMNLNKTEVMYLSPPPGSHEIGQDIQIEAQVLTQVSKL